MVPYNLRLPGSSLLAVELGLQASRHSLDLDRALALNLRPALSDQLLVVEIGPGVIQGSWSKSKSKIKIKKRQRHSSGMMPIRRSS